MYIIVDKTSDTPERYVASRNENTSDVNDAVQFRDEPEAQRYLNINFGSEAEKWAEIQKQ